MKVPDAGMKGNSLYKALIGKIVLVPGSEFGVDVPELYYKGSAPLLRYMLGQRVLTTWSMLHIKCCKHLYMSLLPSPFENCEVIVRVA